MKIAYLDLAALLLVAFLFGYGLAARDRLVERFARAGWRRRFGRDDDVVFPLYSTTSRFDPVAPPQSTAVRVLPRRPWDHAVDG